MLHYYLQIVSSLYLIFLIFGRYFLHVNEGQIYSKTTEWSETRVTIDSKTLLSNKYEKIKKIIKNHNQ